MGVGLEVLRFQVFQTWMFWVCSSLPVRIMFRVLARNHSVAARSRKSRRRSGESSHESVEDERYFRIS